MLAFAAFLKCPFELMSTSARVESGIHWLPQAALQVSLVLRDLVPAPLLAVLDHSQNLTLAFKLQSRLR